MKIRPWFFLGCFCCAVWPLICYAEPALELLEQFPTGSINWTQGVVTAKGDSSFLDVNQPAEQQEGIKDQAFLKAVQNLRQTLARLRMTHNNRILDMFSDQARIQDKIEAMTSAAKIVKTTQTPDNAIEVTLEMNFHGGFSQLVLPADIRQVESIKPLNGRGASNRISNHHLASKQDRESGPDAFSGLVVDARGTGAHPAMVPVLVDENGQEVYGPNYVSREFAVQHGMCRYIRGPVGSFDLPRVAPNPLRVKGLRAVSTGSCDIVISNSDASKLRSVSSHLEFLKQCRVVIIIDESGDSR